MEVEGLVVVVHRAEVPVHDDLGIKLFVNFPDEGLLLRLTRLNLAAGKLPAALEAAISSLRRQDTSVFFDNGCYYVNGFHGMSFMGIVPGDANLPY